MSKEYTKIFCEIFASVSVKTLTFLKYFTFRTKDFFSKTYIFILVHVKKLYQIAMSATARGGGRPLRMLFFYVLPKLYKLSSVMWLHFKHYLTLHKTNRRKKVFLLIYC